MASVACINYGAQRRSCIQGKCLLGTELCRLFSATTKKRSQAAEKKSGLRSNVTPMGLKSKVMIITTIYPSHPAEQRFFGPMCWPTRSASVEPDLLCLYNR